MDIRNMTDVGAYTDLNRLQSLHHQANSNPEVAKKEVAAQFESLLVQMLMKSMRDANHALVDSAEGDSIGAQQMDLYNDLFDKQLSLVVSHSDTGLAKMIETSMDKNQPVTPATQKMSIDTIPMVHSEKPIVTEKSGQNKAIETIEKPPQSASGFDSSSEFVKTLWSSAKEAASLLGADPKFLLAQAALETNWGKSILPMVTGQSSHNLFNIKADSSWHEPAVQVDAVEYEDGLMVKNKSKFRAYESYTDSFKDYVHFLKNNSRYQEALKYASDPHQFATQLQKANYATDEKYSEKIMQIYTSKRFNDLFV